MTTYAELTANLTFADEFTSFVWSPDGSRGWMTRYAWEGEAARALGPFQKPPGEQEFYSDASVGVNPFSCTNSVLTITAAPAAASAADDQQHYTSGIITTLGSLQQTYGYFEARVKLPVGAGPWPAFWMWGANEEIDIFEFYGPDTTTLNFTTHDRLTGVSDGNALTVPDASAAFQVYGLQWEPDGVTLWLDGAPLKTVACTAGLSTPARLLGRAQRHTPLLQFMDDVLKILH